MVHEEIPKLDYRGLGLTVGLEIHQQLATKTKLFCSCPAELTDEEHDVFERKLRPTRSEMGEVDIAALFEWKKGRIYEYQAPISHSCLVEADEEPPHPINREAVIIAMAVAKALGSWIVDEVHVMRKVVIDGSNTSGFQRTAIIALGGGIKVGDKIYSIETIAVEEDASRKVKEEGLRTVYRLDRLGIPLIEISTGPDIHDPYEAYEVALAIGRLLRLTGKVRRGLGTIRQDLNVSIKGGAITEIKGVQRLELIPKVIAYEVLRQTRLLEIKDELKQRGVTKEEILSQIPLDVSEYFRSSKSKIIRRVLSSGGGVYAIKLPKFKGLLKRELMPGRRFGTELADYARFWAGVGGIFHSDELPGYGISEEELIKVYKALNADPNKDAVVIVAEKKDKAMKALEAVLNRAALALDGVPAETRGANEDGTTRYLRPRPGRARMYPETDIPPLEITEDMHKEAEKIKPEPLEVKIKKFKEEYGLSDELINNVIRDIRLDLIEKLMERYRERLSPKIIASIFTVTLRGLRSEGVNVDVIDDKHLEELIDMIAKGEVAKEAAEELLKAVSKNPNKSVRELAKELGLRAITIEEAEKLITEIINENLSVIRERGERALGLIMGRVMSKLRGKIDGRIVAEIVKKKIKEILSG
jgi:glutamyl-tRNA(Gln) amidotransferase subunit E